MRRSMNVDIPPVTHSHQSHATHVDGIVAPTLGLGFQRSHHRIRWTAEEEEEDLLKIASQSPSMLSTEDNKPIAKYLVY